MQKNYFLFVNGKKWRLVKRFIKSTGKKKIMKNI